MNKKYQDIYEAIFHWPVSVNQKRKAFEAVINSADDVYAWPIVGITLEALGVVKAQGSFKGLVRAHLKDRHQRGKELFERPSPVEEVMGVYLKTDETVIATRSENGANVLSQVIALDPELFRTKGARFGIKSNKAILAAVMATGSN